MVSHEAAMAQALEVAAAGRGTTAPNPSVGAVLVGVDGDVIGVGATQPPGGAHAEVMALRDAASRGRDVRGATMVVTLEPCCHFGRSPPCTQTLIAAGVARVVVGTRDPFERVRGRGIAELRAAGVEVVEGIATDACRAQILGFARAQTVGLPEVTVKIATSADGCIATAAGESQWITGPAARAEGRRERAEHDAVLVGVGTVLADDPRLTARDGRGREPVPVVFDTQLRTPASAKLLAGPRRALIIVADDAPERTIDADILRVARGAGGRLDLDAALRGLAGRGLHRVFAEGGGVLHRSLLDARRVDRVLQFVAGVTIPGGRRWLGGEPLARLGDAARMRLADARPIGDDLRLTWELEHACSPVW